MSTAANPAALPAAPSSVATERVLENVPVRNSRIICPTRIVSQRKASEVETDLLTLTLEMLRKEGATQLDSDDRRAYLESVERIRIRRIREQFNFQQGGQLGAL